MSLARQKNAARGCSGLFGLLAGRQRLVRLVLPTDLGRELLRRGRGHLSHDEYPDHERYQSEIGVQVPLGRAQVYGKPARKQCRNVEASSHFGGTCLH